jgi:hypothetical protein
MKAHDGINGNETSDRLAKETTQNHCVTYSRISKSAVEKCDPGRKYKKMTKSVGGNNKRSCY